MSDVKAVRAYKGTCECGWEVLREDCNDTLRELEQHWVESHEGVLPLTPDGRGGWIRHLSESGHAWGWLRPTSQGNDFRPDPSPPRRRWRHP